MSIIGEPSIVQFLAERVDMDALFKAQLFDAIDDSKTDAEAGLTAANAISILVRTGVSFSGADLRGIRISGADLRGGLFDSADFERADLSNVSMAKAWLRQANLNNTQMSGVQFGELPYLVQREMGTKTLFSPDGKVLITANGNGDIIIYDTTTGKRIKTYQGGTCIAISPNILELATTERDENDRMSLRDLPTGKSRLVLSGLEGHIYCISYSPDGCKVASSSLDTTVRMWSTLSGDMLHVLRDHTDEVSRVAFSPTGLRLVSYSADTVRTWDAQTGESLAVLNGHTRSALSVAYSNDGSRIALGDYDGSIRLWNEDFSELCFTLSGHSSFVTDVAFPPDGHQIVSCSEDRTIRLWNSYTGESCEVLTGHYGQINSVAYSPTGDYIASSAWDYAVRLWKTGGGLVDESSGDPIPETLCVDISPCGHKIVTGNKNGSLQLWESLTGNPVAVLRGHTHHIEEVAFSPCGGQIASASSDCTVRLWDAQAKVVLHTLEGHTGVVTSVAFSPNEDHIASASADKSVRIWDNSTGQPGVILEGHTEWVGGVTYSPSDHQIASCNDDKTVRLWCPQTGEQRHVLEHVDTVFQVVYSRDGQCLVSLMLSNYPDNARCWDPESGQPDRRWDWYDTNVLCCSFSPTGKLIAILGRDEWLRLWDVMSGEWSIVHGSKIGKSLDIRWVQVSDCVFLAAVLLHVWKLVERDNTYSVQLTWSTGRIALNMVNASMDGIVGLSPVNLELMKQRGTIAKKIDE